MITTLNEYRKSKKKKKKKSKKHTNMYGLGYFPYYGFGYGGSNSNSDSGDSGSDSGDGGASESLQIEKVNPDVNDDQVKGFILPHLSHRKAIIKMLLHARDTGQVIPSTITLNDSFITSLKKFKTLKKPC